MTVSVQKINRSHLRASYVERNGTFQPIASSTPKLTPETCTTSPSPDQASDTRQTQKSPRNSGSTSTSNRCPRCTNLILGRFKEESSCISCGYAPAMEESDGWVDYIEQMGTRVNSSGARVIDLRGRATPHGKHW